MQVEAAFQVSAETALATEVMDPCNHIEREEYINKVGHVLSQFELCCSQFCY